MKRPILALLLAASAPVYGHASQEREAVQLDFSDVDSVEKAKALAAKGRLVSVLLFPAEFGGEDHDMNRAYITPEAAEARKLLLGTLERMIREGEIDKMEVEPRYKGNSFVPSAISMRAWHSSKGGSFQPVIEIW